MITVSGVCSGVGGFDLAFERAGFDILWNCEIESACQRVLVARFPEVLLQFEDMTGDEILTAPAPDVFVGGTPCQGFSVAGLRKGLNDDRSNLALRFLQLCDHFKPAVILWENVPGVLSDKDNAFGCFLAGLVGADAPLLPTKECGGRWTNAGLVAGPKRTAAWRILDSQYFGLAQRRERVFVVASPRGELPFQILFESEGLRRHSPPSRETREGTAPTLEGRAGRSGANNFATSGGLAAVAPPLNAGGNSTGGTRQPGTCVDNCESLIVAHALRAEGFEASEDGTGRGTPIIPILEAGKRCGLRDSSRDGLGIGESGDPMFTLQSGAQHAVAIRTNAAGQFMNQGDKTAALTSSTDPCSQIVAFQPRYFNDRKRPAGRPNSIIPPLTAQAKSGEAHPCVAYTQVCEHRKEEYAHAYEADASSILSTLRGQVGEEAITQWATRIFVSLQSPKILRSWLHGCCLRCSSDAFRRCVDGCPLPRQEGVPARILRQVWETGPDGRSPQGRGLAKQLANKLGEALSQLSFKITQPKRIVQDLRRAEQGIRALREALSALEKMGRPNVDQRKPAHSGYEVRRLTPTETERLQGFPDNWDQVPNAKGKPMADGPRYKMMGNAVSVPVVEWIAKRIKKALEKP